MTAFFFCFPVRARSKLQEMSSFQFDFRFALWKWKGGFVFFWFRTVGAFCWALFFLPSLVWQVFGVVSGPFPEESDFLRTSEKLFVFNTNLKTDKLWLFFRSLRNWNETKMFRLVPVSNFPSFGTLACFSQEREKCDDLHIFDMFSSPGILSGLFITTLVPYWSEIVVFEVSTSWCSVVGI